MELSIEAFREDTEKLTADLLAVVRQHTASLPYIDRSVIVAAALGNVACTVDVAEPSYTAECTMRLQRVTAAWKPAGG